MVLWYLRIGEGVGGDDGALAHGELREVVLADIELDLQVVQVRQRHDEPLGRRALPRSWS